MKGGKVPLSDMAGRRFVNTDEGWEMFEVFHLTDAHFMLVECGYLHRMVECWIGEISKHLTCAIN